MIVVYGNHEIPEEYIDEIKSNKVNINNIEYIIIPNENYTGCLNLVSRLSNEFILMSLPNMPYKPFYVISKSIDN